MRTYLENALGDTTFHGLGEIVKRKSFCSDRTLWALLFMAGVVASAFLVNQSWKKFQENPVIVTIERNYNEWKMSYPSNIVCPAKALIRKYKPVVYETFGQVDKEKLQYYKNFMAELVVLSGSSMKNMIQYENDTTLANLSLIDFQQKVRENPKVTVTNYVTHKSIIGEFLRSSHGGCFAYNSALTLLSRKGLEYTEKEIINNSVESSDVEVNVFISFLQKGMKVFLNSPYEYPQTIINFHYHDVKGNEYNVFYNALIVHTTVSTPDLRRLSITQRKCVFRDEVKLQVSHIYTPVACQEECDYEEAIEACKCCPLTFYNLGPYEYCDIKGLTCIARQQEHSRGKHLKSCNCLPSCNEETFEAILFSRFRYQTPIIGYHMGEFPRTRFKRDIMFGDLEMLVSFGGIGCLFFGGSLLSVIEVVYLAILHFVRCAIRTYRSEPKLSTVKRLSTRERILGKLRQMRKLNDAEIRNEFVPLRIRRMSRRDAFVQRVIYPRSLDDARFRRRIHCFHQDASLYKNGKFKSHVTIVYKAFRESFKEYMAVSTICGVRYIREAPNHLIRFAWFCVWAFFTILVIIASREMSNKFIHSAVTYVPEQSEKSRNATIPAIAVCIKGIEQPDVSCSKIFSDCSANGKQFDCCTFIAKGGFEVQTCFTFNSVQTNVSLLEDNQVSLDKSFIVYYSFIYSGPLYSYLLAPYEVALERGFGSSFVGHSTTFSKYALAVFVLTDEIADEEVRTIPADIRNCRFPEENEGMWAYRYYSYSACIAQCRAEAKMKLCNCTDVIIGYGGNGEGYQHLCDKKGMDCIGNIEDKLEPVNTFEAKDYGLNCECPISCLQYDVTLYHADTSSEGIEMGEMARIGFQVHLNRIRRRMIVVRNIVDIAVSLGGVAGFFVGASLMSIVEIFYFLLLRPIFLYLTYISGD